MQARRDRLSEEERLEKSRIITERVAGLSAYQNNDRLLVYLDFRSEVRTKELIRRAWEDGKSVAVPRILGKQMDFYEIRDFVRLRKNACGIFEPEGCPPADWQTALMIMPGLAFDRKGHRIGYGGGYYDRYLAAHPELTTVAASFSLQILDSVPCGSHDLRPQIIVTEDEVIRPA